MVGNEDRYSESSVIAAASEYLPAHYAIDLWVNIWCKILAHSEVVVVRYADYTILGLQH